MKTEFPSEIRIMAASSNENMTILKIRIVGVDGTCTNWFFHPTATTVTLENIIQDIFRGRSECVSESKKKELCGDAEFDSQATYDTVASYQSKKPISGIKK